MIVKTKLNVSFLCFAILLIIFVSSSGCGTHSSVKVKLKKEFDLSVKPKVAVLDFKKDSSTKVKESKPFVAGLFLNPDAGAIIAKIFSNELESFPLVNMLSRKSVVKILETSVYDKMEDINREDFGEVAKLLGVDAIITGTFTRFGFLYPTIVPRIMLKFTVEYYEAATDSVVWVAKVKDYSSREVDERVLARKRVKNVLEKLEKVLNKANVNKIDKWY